MRNNHDTPPLSWKTLNAYVDGELEAHMAAAVASAVALDLVLARRVATLSRLKANVAVRQSEYNASSVLRVLPARSRRNTVCRRAAAVLLLLATGLLIGFQFAGQSDQPEWLVAVVTAQRQWIAAVGLRSSSSYQIAIEATLAGRPLDLSAAELRLVYAVPTPLLATQGSFLGYRGPHGCLLGFWTSSSAVPLPDRPIAMDRGDIEVRAWRHGADTFALLSKGMDPARLNRLAEIVAQLTDPSHSVDDTFQVALREVQHVGAACRV